MAKPNLPDEITITVNPAKGTIKVAETNDGVTGAKYISPSALVSCFEKGITESKCVESGFLPENCLSVSVTDRMKHYVIWHKALYADITYHDTLYGHFPIPRMAFGFDVMTNGRVAGCRVAVTADEKPTPETRVFEWPFSNVYANGGICIGAANSLPVYKDARTLSTLPYLILSLPNNDHNYSRGGNRLKLGYRELLDLLRDKDPSYYYGHVLIPQKGRTLKHFTEQN
jgi:hypothetical protein